MARSLTQKVPLIRPFQLVVLAGALILAMHLGSLLFLRAPEARQAASQALIPLAGLLASGALFLGARTTYRRAARGEQARRLAWGWGLLSLAALVYAGGDFLWYVLTRSQGGLSFPSPVDYFYLGGILLLLIGSLLLAQPQSPTRECLHNALDIGIMAIATTLLYWNFVIGPLEALQQSVIGGLWMVTIAYPILDLSLLWVLVLLFYNRADVQPTQPVILFSAGVTLIIAVDAVYALQTLAGGYTSGSLWDIFWTLAYLLLLLAGARQAEQGAPSLQKMGDGQKNWINILMKLARAYAPYVWLVGAFALLVESHYLRLAISFQGMAWGVGGIVGLVMARQILALDENQRLLGAIQQALAREQQQAAQLEYSNVSLTHEIMERKRIERQLAHDALHDALTQLPNRALFLDRLGRAMEYTRRRGDHPFSVMMLDLDQFKVINDSLGHTCGDHLLIEVSHRLRECLRSADTVARIGGDEFVILLESITDPPTIHYVADRIQELFERAFVIEGDEVRVSASMGVIPSIAGYEQPDDVLRDVDIAMYRAKALGKARYEIFHSTMRAQAVSRLHLENELRQAIQNDAFVLHYQPIYALKTHEIIGFEALVRWQHPRRGLLGPGEFIRVAEDSGLVVAMGEWVLREACRQMCVWRARYARYQTLSINVNISGKQIVRPDFVEQVEQVLRDTGLDAAALKLELTESVLIENPYNANGFFTRLNDLGVQLEIDDFGTGYSSLSYLQHFPVQSIKIDQSFVQEIDKPGKTSDLVRTMIMMARDLGMQAIAEGVETHAQLEELRRLTCAYGQGFFLSRPLDSSAATRLLEG